MTSRSVMVTAAGMAPRIAAARALREEREPSVMPLSDAEGGAKLACLHVVFTDERRSASARSGWGVSHGRLTANLAHALPPPAIQTLSRRPSRDPARGPRERRRLRHGV